MVEIDTKELKQRYKQVLSKVDAKNYTFDEDRYSGVFLSYPFDGYRAAKVKVMIVGRETAGWNTNNGKNTIKRIIEKNQDNQIDELIEESLTRYSWHLRDKANGKVRTKHRSHFKRYFTNVAKQLDVDPEGIVYANLFAWDYNGKSPLGRPENELEKVTEVSMELLAEQIRLYQPEHIIFATGVNKVDPVIKKLFETHFTG